MTTTAGERAFIVHARDVSKTYRLGEVQVRALDEVSLGIEPGEFVIVAGRNGAGKSTLMHILAALDEPDRGEVLIDGRDVTRMSNAQRVDLRLGRLGYIFQEHALIAELTALENVMLPAMMLASAGEAKKRAETLLERVGLTDHAGHLPSQLSGGQQQRTAIARALVNDPSILFADEPTASLDSISAREVLETFARLNREDRHTIVMVSHEDDDARYARRRVRLSDGRIVEDQRLS